MVTMTFMVWNLATSNQSHLQTSYICWSTFSHFSASCHFLQAQESLLESRICSELPSKSAQALLTSLWSSLLFILPSSNWFVPCDWFWAAPREQGFWEEDVFLSAKFMAVFQERKHPPAAIVHFLFATSTDGHVYVILGSQWQSQYEMLCVTIETWLAIAVILVWLPL